MVLISLVGRVAYANANRLSPQSVVAESYGLGGEDGGNYQGVLQTNTGLKVWIYEASVSITGFEITKPYDGTINYSGDLGELVFVGLLNNETLTVGSTGVTAKYENAMVGEEIGIIFSGNFTVTRPGTTSPGNYSVAQPVAIKGSITKALPIVTGKVEIKDAVAGTIVADAVIESLSVTGVLGETLNGTWCYTVPEYTDGSGRAVAVFIFSDENAEQNYMPVEVEVIFVDMREEALPEEI